jgi:hypothetical protein
MKEPKPVIIYSDPVNEIMGNPPRKIIRWGTSILFSVFVIFLLFSWLIRYPDNIPSPIEITTVNPPVTLVSKHTGRIKNLYVSDREEVMRNQLIAVMETTASISDIEVLKTIIDTVKKPETVSPNLLPELLELGELQEFYSSFIKNLIDLLNYNTNDFYGNKIKSLTKEIIGTEEYIKRLFVKEVLYSENQKLEANKYERDSLLFINKVIPEIDLEKSHQSFIRFNIELQQVRLESTAKSIELAEKRQLLLDYQIKRMEEGDKLISILGESFLNLKAQINIWENNYLLISPIKGMVSFSKFWTANQLVVKDEPVINIIPHETGDFLGRISLKMQRSGKVKAGQLVNIKLSSYPYLEYGMLRGIVISKSLVTSGNKYIIEVNLPDGLTTVYGKTLEFNQNMQGTAEIITDDIRLLQKIFNPFRYLLSKNKR